MSRKSPRNWKIVLDGIKEMRKDRNAPVDLLGCHMLAQPSASAKDRRYQTLLALLLSPQTKDAETAAAMGRIYDALKPEICSASVFLSRFGNDLSFLQKLVHPVGFFRRKSQTLVAVSEICLDQYDGDIPNTIAKLTKLPGVGPKIAHLVMQNAWDVNSGIGVDLHVHRIANRLHWVASSNTKSPDQTRIDLEDWLPPQYWREINPLLVGFGQTICTSQRPDCSNCLIREHCYYSGPIRK